MRTPDRRIAVAGARGRLGRALIIAGGPRVVSWDRPAYDLDRPSSARHLIARDRPRLVIHAAAMTDVDRCAREPEAAMRRNGDAVEALASACAAHEADLMLISSNEVFDGERSDGLGYGEDDPVHPRNAYGQSKLAGELAAQGVYGAKPGLWIVRTAWLYGAPGGDFPDRIVAAADRLPAHEPLPVVEDEVGSPTLATDLAEAIMALAERTDGGVFHLVNRGSISRLGWAERVLAACRPQRRLRSIPRATYRRDSDPPPWAVLDGSKAASRAGIRLRDWREACDAELERRAATAPG